MGIRDVIQSISARLIVHFGDGPAMSTMQSHKARAGSVNVRAPITLFLRYTDDPSMCRALRATSASISLLLSRGYSILFDKSEFPRV